MNDIQKIGSVLECARLAAIDYYRITGKPLGITGEYGEYIVAKRLKLKLEPARTAGYDAMDKAGRRIQIKARSIPSDKKLGGQRLGSIRLDQKWDIVLLVVMNECFEVRCIYEAERKAIEAVLKAPPISKARKRGVLSLPEFKNIGRQVWPVG